MLKKFCIDGTYVYCHRQMDDTCTQRASNESVGSDGRSPSLILPFSLLRVNYTGRFVEERKKRRKKKTRNSVPVIYFTRECELSSQYGARYFLVSYDRFSSSRVKRLKRDSL